MIGAKQYGMIYMKNSGSIPPIKERESKKKPDPEARISDLEKWRDDVRKDLESIRNIRLELSEFIFQTVAIIIGIFALIITVFLAISTKFEIEQGFRLDIMVLFLGVIALFSLIWVVNWFYITFWKRRY